MKLFAFSDTHLNKKAVQKIKHDCKHADLIICAGDLSWFGTGLKKILKELNSHLRELNKEMYIIPGNHEEPGTELHALCKELSQMQYVHKRTKKILNYKFFFWGGGGFAQENKQLEKLMHAFKKTLTKEDKVILVTHGPPYNTKLDFLPWAGHVGCKSQIKFLREIKPILHIFGHLHEHMNEHQLFNNRTLLVNVGAAGTMIEV